MVDAGGGNRPAPPPAPKADDVIDPAADDMGAPNGLDPRGGKVGRVAGALNPDRVEDVPNEGVGIEALASVPVAPKMGAGQGEGVGVGGVVPPNAGAGVDPNIDPEDADPNGLGDGEAAASDVLPAGLFVAAPEKMGAGVGDGAPAAEVPFPTAPKVRPGAVGAAFGISLVDGAGCERPKGEEEAPREADHPAAPAPPDPGWDSPIPPAMLSLFVGSVSFVSKERAVLFPALSPPSASHPPPPPPPPSLPLVPNKAPPVPNPVAAGVGDPNIGFKPPVVPTSELEAPVPKANAVLVAGPVLVSPKRKLGAGALAGAGVGLGVGDGSVKVVPPPAGNELAPNLNTVPAVALPSSAVAGCTGASPAGKAAVRVKGGRWVPSEEAKGDSDAWVAAQREGWEEVRVGRAGSRVEGVFVEPARLRWVMMSE